MRRTVVYAICLGLLGAGIVHIAILLLLPAFSSQDAWSRLAGRSPLYAWARLDGAGTDPAARALDPFFFSTACRFDLTDGPVRIRAAGVAPFWSISVYDRAARNLFSFNDRTSPDGELDAVVATPARLIELRNELPAEMRGAVLIEADIDEGMTVVRAFVPDDTWTGEVTAFLNGLTCEPQG